MTNESVEIKELIPSGLIDNAGYKLGYIDSGAKAAQNDTWTAANATDIKLAWPTLDATGAAEAHTIAANVITLAGATGTPCSALVLYKNL